VTITKTNIESKCNSITITDTKIETKAILKLYKYSNFGKLYKTKTKTNLKKMLREHGNQLFGP